ncbi:MAG: hypothetical protein JSS71_00580 [Armatimonadetes bacterium]|nr:hypothetical protein [Armatimonadota bacterium]MBX3110089.1 hypothetical protein [Fimbriimonadaceae bacterium]
MIWLIPVALILAAFGLLAWRAFNGRREPGYLALTEYWLYTTGTKLPDQTELMDRMISANPHNRPGKASIGAREGLLFTDVRVHLAVALKDKNPTFFRPDLFEEGVEPTKEILERLAKCPALVKVRYASEARLKDFRHLQFLPHMVDALAEKMGGEVVFDHISERMTTAGEFQGFLEQNNNAERPDFHLRIAWMSDEDGSFARTFGLRKIGWDELRTEPQEDDRQVLMTGLLTRLAHHIFRNPEDPGPWEFDEYGDVFILQLAGRDPIGRRVGIVRRQVVS